MGVFLLQTSGITAIADRAGPKAEVYRQDDPRRQGGAVVSFAANCNVGLQRKGEMCEIEVVVQNLRTERCNTHTHARARFFVRWTPAHPSTDGDVA